MSAIFALAALTGSVGSTILFGFISFMALREFITLTPTRRGDHRSLSWVFFVIAPLLYLFVGTGNYAMFTILIPVYAFLLNPAHFASWFAHPEVARLLILNGAALNLRFKEQASPPVGWANESGQHGMVKFLLELGARINISQTAGLGKLEMVQSMLQEDPTLVHFQAGWGTPLHEACGWGQTEGEMSAFVGGGSNAPQR